jgi:hypothetical protein
MNGRPLLDVQSRRSNDWVEGVNGRARSRSERSERPVRRSKAAVPSSARRDNVDNFQPRGWPEVGLAIKSADNRQGAPRKLDGLAAAAWRPARR